MKSNHEIDRLKYKQVLTNQLLIYSPAVFCFHITVNFPLPQVSFGADSAREINFNKANYGTVSWLRSVRPNWIQAYLIDL